MTRIALGLFHFNINEVIGDPAASHRYCTQVVLPFLRTVEAHSSFRVTFEFAGVGLEFLAEHYPGAINILQSLIQRRQVELVSSTYASTAWVAFPWRDLEQSIRLNRKVLDRLNLAAAPIFFAQEGLFGPGLEVVSDWFDMAVCKDTALRILSDKYEIKPIHKLGRLKVIVGANHILNEVASAVVQDSQKNGFPDLSSFYEARLQDFVEASFQSALHCIDGKVSGTHFHWYHVGSAHHFTTTTSPQNWEVFYCDPTWMEFTVAVLERLSSEGVWPGFIGEFASAIADEPVDPMPKMIETGWNPKQSRGVYAWMGRHEHRWEAGSALLNLAWRARKAVRKTENTIESLEPDQQAKLNMEVEAIWKQQILAESSDPLGSTPLPCEVNYGREQGDRVLQMCAALLSGLPSCPEFRVSPFVPNGTRHLLKSEESPVEVELISADGQIVWRQHSATEYVCEIRFRPNGQTSGARFRLMAERVIYCPSGLEHQPLVIESKELPAGYSYLPLTNGLICLSDTVHLIRDNFSVGVAARIADDEPWVGFAIDGAQEGRLHEWLFYVILGTVDEAIQVANNIHDI